MRDSTKYAWIKPLTYKNARTVHDVVVGILNETKCKPNQIFVDQGKELYHNLIQKWSDDNDALMCLTMKVMKVIQ